MLVSRFRSRAPGRTAALAILLAAGALSGCATVDRTVPTSLVPDDFHQRHPVVLANEPTFLEVFPVGAAGRLDKRTERLVESFAQDYRQNGQGPILIRAPDRPADLYTMERTIVATRQALLHFGVRSAVEVGRYPVVDPRLASPLHLSFVKLQARVASRCGDWPDDLNSGANTNGWQNHTYYNLGCASAKTFAAQMDDPRDLLGPRADDPSDVQMRTRAIGLLRGSSSVSAGQDPGTNWTGATPTPLTPLGAY